VWLEDGATVRAFSRIQGPAFIGRDSTLLGGAFSALSIGPVCKVHGEMEETVVLGYSNKAHDGFLGHAYLGRWVNLGALTTNSDLKNNYGTIRMWTPEGEVDTGLVKMGCLLGDHVKTGIGVMVNTGTIVGAGCNLFGAVQPPKHVPPFKWGSGGELVDHEIEKFLDTAKTVMGRRGITLSDAQAGLLRRAWSRSRSGGGERG
jgi:UDP-N-acetylglucosamine diphosphorylase/glucosamine-1-phosphate N-acetyltransferase